jgi:predicted nucleic acid-binding protein
VRRTRRSNRCWFSVISALAREHRLPLVTRDSRAVAIYDAFEVDLVFVE